MNLSPDEEFADAARGAFRVWQEAGDAFFRAWFGSPGFVGMRAGETRFALDAADAWIEFWTRFGFGREELKSVLRSGAKIRAIGSQFSLAGIKTAQAAGFLPRTAPTPFRVILKTPNYRLLRYRSGSRRHRTPFLIVSSLVGRHYILDLTPGRSFAEFMLNEGFDVFVVEWTTTDAAENLGLEHYAGKFLGEIVSSVRGITNARPSLLGYSMGGILSLIYAAQHPATIRNLITLAAPVDFSQRDLVAEWTSADNFDVERVLEITGNVPAEFVSMSLQMLKPVTSAMRGANLLLHSKNREDYNALLALEIWLADAAPLPARLFREIVTELYRENRLAAGTLRVGGKKVDLGRIKCPVLNVIANFDQVAKPVMAERLADMVSSRDTSTFSYDYGHLTIVAGHGAPQTFWKDSADWLAARSSAR